MASSNLRPVFIKITVFHLVALFVIVMALTESPGIGEYFPVGTSEQTLTTPRGGDWTEPVYLDRIEGSHWSARLLFLILSFACSVGLSVPVAWAYLATRNPRKRDATFAQAIVLMPVAVTGLVLVVQNSLALAFALAGIATFVHLKSGKKDAVDDIAERMK